MKVAMAPVITPEKPEEAEKKPISYLEVEKKDIALGADFSKNKGRLPWSDIKSIHYSDAGKEGANGLMLELNSGEEVRLNFDLAIDQEEGLICAATLYFFERSKKEPVKVS